MALGPIELVMLLLVVATGLAYVGRRIGVAYPILLVLGGLVLGALGFALAPDLLAEVQLEPDLVFLLFLPPILFGSGFSTPIRDLKANARPVALLAIGLVLFSTVVVGLLVGVLIPELRGGPAFALGAIVAPPDAVAATAILRRLGVPPRIVTILEGESLVNDGSALIAYRFAVAVAMGGAFSLLDASVSFVVVGIGGIIVGAVVGILVTSAWRRTGDPTLEIVLSLLAPLTAYLAAETLGLSGVLSTVTAGLIAGRKAARVLSPDGRLSGQGVWAVLIFLINSFVFMLIGLQLPIVLRGLSTRSASELIGLGAIVSVTVIVARIVWVYPATYLPRFLNPRLRARDPSPPARAIFVVGLGGDARCRLARRGPGPAAGVPRARPHHLSRLLRHRGDARRPGPDAALDHPPVGHRGRIGRRPRGGCGPPGGGPGGARAAGRAGRRVSGPPRAGGSAAVAVRPRGGPCPGRRRRRRPMPPNRSASTTSPSASRWSPPSARRSSGSATTG